MVEELIHKELRKGLFKRERRKLRPREALLLNMKIHTSSRTLNSILDIWQEVNGKLFFDNHLDEIPGHLSIHQLLDLMHRDGDPHEERRREIVAYYMTTNLNTVRDFWLGVGGWISLEQVHGNLCCNRHSAMDTLSPILDFLGGSSSCGEERLESSKGWIWLSQGVVPLAGIYPWSNGDCLDWRELRWWKCFIDVGALLVN